LHAVPRVIGNQGPGREQVQELRQDTEEWRQRKITARDWEREWNAAKDTIETAARYLAIIY